MIYVWDNGEEFSDHAVWFVESELDPDLVERLLNAAVNPFSRAGGVIAVLERSAPVVWKQDRIEPLEVWFGYHGDALVNWKTRPVYAALARLPKEAAKRLTSRLSAGNAAILNKNLGLDD